jgi:hypothetical protein
MKAKKEFFVGEAQQLLGLTKCRRQIFTAETIFSSTKANNQLFWQEKKKRNPNYYFLFCVHARNPGKGTTTRRPALRR